MIRVAGREYGTAAEIARALGGDVTTAMVRNCDGLTRYRYDRRVYFPLDQAAATIKAALGGDVTSDVEGTIEP